MIPQLDDGTWTPFEYECANPLWTKMGGENKDYRVSNKAAIAFLTKDRAELTRQSIKPLFDTPGYDLFWMDGSETVAGIDASLSLAYPRAYVTNNVKGGAGAAIVFALTTMLNRPENYEYVGLVENDVLLPADWFAATVALFQRGLDDGLAVGAVSARCFEDRVLFQRDGYAVMHNLGAGMVLFSRRAARIVLNTFRTGWTVDNRRIFSRLCGIDIGPTWAFRANEHVLTADWHWDAVLAAHGLASLALTPSPVEMIGQVPPLEEQGLKIANKPFYHVEVSNRLQIYAEKFRQVRDGELQLGVETQFQFDSNTGTWTYFPHQMAMLGGNYSGDWRLRELRGWGTFGWEASRSPDDRYNNPALLVPVAGPVAVLVSGGKIGGKAEVTDEHSGFCAVPELAPEGDEGQVLQVMVPGGISHRNIRVVALTPGVTFYGLQTRERQPHLPSVGFDFSMLPPT